MKVRGIIWLIAFAIFISLSGNASVTTATTIHPTVDGSVRDGPPFGVKDGIPDSPVDRSIVQALNVPTFEERGVVEFSLSTLSQPISSAQLILPVFASNGPFPFTVDVLTYVGDGVLTLADWDQGSLFTTFPYSGEPTVTLNVTSFISSALAEGDAFAGFNLRFAVPSNIALNGPFVAFNSLEFPPAASLTVNVTGPCTLLLLSIGLGGVLVRARLTSWRA